MWEGVEEEEENKCSSRYWMGSSTGEGSGNGSGGANYGCLSRGRQEEEELKHMQQGRDRSKRDPFEGHVQAAESCRRSRRGELGGSTSMGVVVQPCKKGRRRYDNEGWEVKRRLWEGAKARPKWSKYNDDMGWRMEVRRRDL